MFKGPGKIVRDNESSSYPVFELTGVNCILIANMNNGSDSYKACHFLRDCNKNFQVHICKLL